MPTLLLLFSWALLAMAPSVRMAPLGVPASGGLPMAGDVLMRTAIINQSFQGYKVIRAVPEAENQVQVLRGLLEDPSLDFWTFPAGVMIPVDILTPPENLAALEETLKQNDISYTFIMEDLDTKIDSTISTDSARSPIADFTFSEYHDSSVISRQLAEWADRYPDLVTVTSIGQSAHDKKDIQLLTIKSTTLGTQPKPAMFIDGGIHAREWISPATVMYIARQLLNAKDDASTRFMLESFDWYLVPVLNPDGYDYTHQARINRLWRKNRSGAGNGLFGNANTNSGGLAGRRINLLADQLSRAICPGVDLNRNFAFQWKSGGSSEWACSEIYAGPDKESEAETKALSKFLLDNKNTIKSYITFHSYGRAILTPWGYTTAHPDNYAELTRVGNIFKDAIAASAESDGRRSVYTVGSAANLFYIASGGSDDFAYGAAGIPYAYTIELPDSGSHGFLLPPADIAPVGKETFAGLMAYARELSTTLVAKVRQELLSGPTDEPTEVIKLAESTQPDVEKLAAEVPNKKA